MNRVAILMSTFNGSDYIIPQLDSLIAQTGVEISIFIRDDGSTDDTVELINRYALEHEDIDITLLSDNLGNVGVYESWELLLNQVPRLYDYYAISDQDDIWLSDKLESATASLHSLKKPAIWTCNTIAVDKDLNLIKEYDFTSRNASVQAQFIRFSIPAHTMVFNRSLLSAMDKFFEQRDLSSIFTLEPRLIITCLSLKGVWIMSRKAFVMWRRNTGHNVTVSGSGVLNRFRKEIELFRENGLRLGWASVILESVPRLEIEESIYKFLCDIINADKSLFRRIRLVFSTNFTTGNLLLDMLGKVRFIFPNY